MPRTDFTVTLRPQPNVDAIKALRRLLKFAGRQLGLRAIRIEERQGSDVEPPLALTIRLDVWDAADTAHLAEGLVRTGQSSGFVGHVTPCRRPAFCRGLRLCTMARIAH
jgi:hypothetical protein